MKRLFATRTAMQIRLTPVLLAALGAAAQVPPGPPPSSKERPAQRSVAPDDDSPPAESLGSIVVTAQKRSQLLQDVPLTVNVIGAKEIEEAHINQIVDVVNRIPGIAFDSFPATQPRPAVRGIGSSDRGAAGDPSTAVFIDEVYYGRPAAIAFDAFDVERIEVLKGPQGTLWGKNVVGGLIHVVNRRPELDDIDASAALTLGNYRRIEGAGFLNVPVGDGAAVRLSASSRRREGFAANTYLGGRQDDDNTQSGRLQLLLAPGERWSVLIGGDYTRDRLTGSARHTIGVDPSTSLRTLWTNAVDPDPDAVRSDERGHQNRDSKGVRAGVDLKLDPFVVTSISSYRWLDYNMLEDGDGGNPTTNRINFKGGQIEDTRFWSQELRLSAPDKSAIKWVVGGYLYRGDTRRTDLLIVDRPPAPSGSFRSLDQYDQHAVTDSAAVFGDVTVPVARAVNVFGGVRYSRDKKDYDLSTAASTDFLRSAGPYSVSASDSWGKATYRAGVDFKPSDAVLVYGVISTGYKSGGFQDTPSTAASAVIPFAPESATNYEIGVKTTLLDRKLIFNPSIFWTHYENLQVRSTVGTDTFTTNAGSARIKGFELTAEVRPVEGLSIAATYAYTDARFRRLIDRGVDYSGNWLTRNPKQKLAVTPSYRFALASGASITTAVDYQYESKIYDGISNDPNEVRPATSLVDARIVLDTHKQWQFSVWGKNLTNEIYRTHVFYLFGGQFAVYGPLRTYGATATWRF